MYTDYYSHEEYPFRGIFYKIGVDNSRPLDERVEEEIEILRTPCDMADGSDINQDTFVIYFPIDFKEEQIPILPGDMIRADIAGLEHVGRVAGIFPSELGGCSVTINRI